MKVDTFWIGLSNLEPKQCLATQNILWIIQDLIFQYEDHMRIFNSYFGIWIDGRKFWWILHTNQDA